MFRYQALSNIGSIRYNCAITHTHTHTHTHAHTHTCTHTYTQGLLPALGEGGPEPMRELVGDIPSGIVSIMLPYRVIHKYEHGPTLMCNIAYREVWRLLSPLVWCIEPHVGEAQGCSLHQMRGDTSHTSILQVFGSS